MGDPTIKSAIARDAKRLGFSIANQTIEVTGTCANCQKTIKS
jgi:Fe2+ or Zn2+ uptake regulation protein